MRALDISAAKAELYRDIIQGDTPPWHRLSSRQLAQCLGVSIQQIATWKMRETGPDPLPWKKGMGHKTFYRRDAVAAWCSDGTLEPWEICRNWLDSRGFIVEGGNTEESVSWWESGLSRM